MSFDRFYILCLLLGGGGGGTQGDKFVNGARGHGRAEFYRTVNGVVSWKERVRERPLTGVEGKRAQS